MSGFERRPPWCNVVSPSCVAANMAFERRPGCPPWCNRPGVHSVVHAHDVSFDGASVVVGQVDGQPLELRVWLETESPYRSVRIGQADAVTLARVLSALKPEDLIRFAAALADGARLVHDGDGSTS